MITKVILISKNDKIVYSTEQTQLAEKIRQELDSWEEERLKTALERNFQDPSGDYDELFARTLDGMVLGRIPHCPNCASGILRFDTLSGTYSCVGGQGHASCLSVFDMEEIERLPWKNEEQDEATGSKLKKNKKRKIVEEDDVRLDIESKNTIPANKKASEAYNFESRVKSKLREELLKEFENAFEENCSKIINSYLAENENFNPKEDQVVADLKARMLLKEDSSSFCLKMPEILDLKTIIKLTGSKYSVSYRHFGQERQRESAQKNHDNVGFGTHSETYSSKVHDLIIYLNQVDNKISFFTYDVKFLQTKGGSEDAKEEKDDDDEEEEEEEEGIDEEINEDEEGNEDGGDEEGNEDEANDDDDDEFWELDSNYYHREDNLTHILGVETKNKLYLVHYGESFMATYAVNRKKSKIELKEIELKSKVGSIKKLWNFKENQVIGILEGLKKLVLLTFDFEKKSIKEDASYELEYPVWNSNYAQTLFLFENGQFLISSNFDTQISLFSIGTNFKLLASLKKPQFEKLDIDTKENNFLLGSQKLYSITNDGKFKLLKNINKNLVNPLRLYNGGVIGVTESNEFVWISYSYEQTRTIDLKTVFEMAFKKKQKHLIAMRIILGLK